MIKNIESETIEIKSVGDDRIEIFFTESVSGGSVLGVTLTIDELNDLRSMIDTYWSANNLYNQTSEAKEERKRYEVQGFQTPNGVLRAPIRYA